MAFSFRQQLWFKLAPFPHNLGWRLSTCYYGNDIFMVGGDNYPKPCLRYISAENKWKILKSMHRGRGWSLLVATTDALYAIGGYTTSPINTKQIKTVEKYSFDTCSWGYKGALVCSAPLNFMYGAVSGEQILIFGMNRKTNRQMILQCYNTTTNDCTRLTTTMGCLTHFNIVKFDERILWISPDGQLKEFNPSDGTFKHAMNLEPVHCTFYDVVQHRGDIYIIGGRDKNTQKYCADIHFFNLVTSASTLLPTQFEHLRYNGSCLKIAISKQYLKEEL